MPGQARERDSEYFGEVIFPLGAQLRIEKHTGEVRQGIVLAFDPVTQFIALKWCEAKNGMGNPSSSILNLKFIKEAKEVESSVRGPPLQLRPVDFNEIERRLRQRLDERRQTLLQQRERFKNSRFQNRDTRCSSGDYGRSAGE